MADLLNFNCYVFSTQPYSIRNWGLSKAFSPPKKSAVSVLLQRLMSSKSAMEGNFVHPCTIAGRPALVHAADLISRDPEFYYQLQAYAEREGCQLVADRRSEGTPDQLGRRKHWLPVLVISLGLNSAAAAENVVSKSAGGQVLGLFDAQVEQQFTQQAEQTMAHPEAHNQLNSLLQRQHDGEHFFDYEFSPNAVSAQLERILFEHYVTQDTDPAFVKADIRQMAGYFSQYPDVVELLVSLADSHWQLQYATNTFETEVRGSGFQVQAVNIRFDSRSAAQLRKHRDCEIKANANACIASPADALLHELLHAKSALLETQRFIEQGGLSSVLYPYAHEYDVIKNEKQLYHAMSQHDGVPRPQRHKHAGRLLASSCSFCVQ